MTIAICQNWQAYNFKAKEVKFLMVSMTIAAVVVMGPFAPRLVMAGDLEPPAEAVDGYGEKHTNFIYHLGFWIKQLSLKNF
jgi:hypothetical protein